MDILVGVGGCFGLGQGEAALSQLEVAHQPLEYFDVTVHRNIDVVHRCCVCQVLLEVLHVLDQQVFVACEVFVYLAVLVKNVNHDGLSLGREHG